MIAGIGVDQVVVSRIASLLDRHRDRFLGWVFTAGERADCEGGVREAEKLAGRFAAKEAVLKALGTGLVAGMTWRDVETRADASGVPRITLSGRVVDRFKELGGTALHLSITHDGGTATAFVVVEKLPAASVKGELG